MPIDAGAGRDGDNVIVSGAGTDHVNGRYIKGKWCGDFGTHGVTEIWRHETHHDVVIGYYNHFGTRRSRWSIRKHANNNDWYGSGDGDHTSHPADLRWHVVKELGTPGLEPPPTVRREIAGPPGKLQVQVVRGTGLAGKNLAVKLTLGKQVFVTRPVARGTDPIWNATHDFELYAEPELRLEVFDDETVTVAMGADDYIQPDRYKVVGHARVKIHWIAAGTFETDVYVLDKSKKMAGKVTLKATLSRPSGGGDAEPAREPVTGVVVEGEVAPEAPMMEAEPWGEVASEGEVQLGGEFELEGES